MQMKKQMLKFIDELDILIAKGNRFLKKAELIEDPNDGSYDIMAATIEAIGDARKLLYECTTGEMED